MNKIKDFKKTLQNKGFKVTPARKAILFTFKKVRIPMSAEDIYKKLRRKKIDSVTIYRTLASFEKEGIIRRVDLRQDAVYFELNDEHHHHIICTNCGLVEEFENCDTEKIARKIVKESANFINISQHSFEFFGLCKACS